METKVEIKDNLKTDGNENAYIIAITKAEGKTIHVKITEEELSDLIGDALDGGDYWIGRIRVVEKDKEEAKKLTNPDFQKDLAEGISQGILSFLDAQG